MVKSFKLLLIISFFVHADEYVNHWAHNLEPSAASQEIERQEVLGVRPVVAGARTEYHLQVDTSHTRTCFSVGKNFIKWSPFALGEISIGNNDGVITPLQAGNILFYQYGNLLKAYVDGYVYRRVPGAEMADSVIFLSRGIADPNQLNYNYDHITGGSSFDAGQNIAFLEATTQFLDIGIGKKRLRWGNGFNGGLIISGNAPAMNLFYKLHKTIGDIISVTAFLGTPEYNRSFFPDSIKVNSKFAQGERYAAGHRIEVALGNRVKCALNEVVNFNGQNEFNRYLNPLQVYYLTSAHSDLSSNLLASGEFWVKVVNGLAFYGELLNDDITMLTAGNPTRLAYQLGATWFGLGKKKDIDIRSEYTYVRAYTYTHFQGSKNWHIWANQSAGYWLGPDSDYWFFLGEKKLENIGSLRLRAHLVRRGEKGLRHFWNAPVDGSGENVPYIQGAKERIAGVDVSATISMFKILSIAPLVGIQLVQSRTNENHGSAYFQTLMRICY